MSDNEAEETVNDNEAVESPKTKRRTVFAFFTATKIEGLIDQQDWDEVRKRLKRTSSPKRIGALLYHASDNPSVPDDVFEILFEKVRGNREFQGSGFFWQSEYESAPRIVSRDRYKDFDHVFYRRPPESMALFLNEYMSVSGKMSLEGTRRLIRRLWRRYLTGSEAGVLVHEEKQELLSRIYSMDDLQSNDELYSLWQKTEILIKSREPFDLDKPEQDVPFLFAHALIKHESPTLLVWLALRVYPQQLIHRDGLKRIPLHWAAEIRSQRSYLSVAFHGKLREIDKQDPVELVFEWFPGGASFVDFEGSLPLDLLLDRVYRDESAADKRAHTCILALAKKAPEALMKRNKKNHMFPFLTATCTFDSADMRTQAQENSVLELSYSLLRLDPSVIAFGLHETHREADLKRLLHKAESKICRLEEELERLQEENMRLRTTQGHHAAAAASSDEFDEKPHAGNKTIEAVQGPTVVDTKEKKDGPLETKASDKERRMKRTNL